MIEWREEQARREEETQEKMAQEKQDARHAVNVSERAVGKLFDDREGAGDPQGPAVPKPSGLIACCLSWRQRIEGSISELHGLSCARCEIEHYTGVHGTCSRSGHMAGPWVPRLPVTGC